MSNEASKQFLGMLVNVPSELSNLLKNVPNTILYDGQTKFRLPPHITLIPPRASITDEAILTYVHDHFPNGLPDGAILTEWTSFWTSDKVGFYVSLNKPNTAKDLHVALLKSMDRNPQEVLKYTSEKMKKWIGKELKLDGLALIEGSTGTIKKVKL